MVFSRAGVTSNLLAYDIAALRFMVAGTIVLPFCWAWWPSHLPLKAKLLMASCGPGAVYTMIMYFGLTEASAAYGGVFSNGSLPIFTMLLVFIVTGDKPFRNQLIAIAIIIFGGILLAASGVKTGGNNVVLGIVLFLLASAVMSVYIFGVRQWGVTPRQALALVTMPSALIYLPIWYFFLPSGMAETEQSIIIFQAFFQGFGPGFFAVILFALAAMHLGATMTAGFSAVVPATAALLAIPILGEIPNTMEWIAIGIVTVGLGLLIMSKKPA
jgi:drug/metabolite transporter (DMT)-like permease